MFPFSHQLERAKARIQRSSHRKLQDIVDGQNMSGRDGPVLRQVVLIQNLLQSADQSVTLEQEPPPQYQDLEQVSDNNESMSDSISDMESLAESIRRDEELWLDSILDECLEGDEEYINIFRVQSEQDMADSGYSKDYSEKFDSKSRIQDAAEESSLDSPPLLMTPTEDDDDDEDDDHEAESPRQDTSFAQGYFTNQRSPHPPTISLYYPARDPAIDEDSLNDQQPPSRNTLSLTTTDCISSMRPIFDLSCTDSRYFAPRSRAPSSSISISPRISSSVSPVSLTSFIA